jgi:hypothetical protein
MQIWQREVNNLNHLADMNNTFVDTVQVFGWLIQFDHRPQGDIQTYNGN